MKRVLLTNDEIQDVLSSIRIAVEDGSVFGGDDPGSDGYEATLRRLESAEKKLRIALRAR